MAEIWGAAIAAGGAILGGVAKSKQAKEDRKNAKEDAKIANADEAKWSSLMSQFEREQDYRYEQLGRQNKERGLAEFRKFHTMSSIDPTYAQTHGGVVVPEARGINQMAADYDKKQAEIDGANTQTYGGNTKKKGILDTIDPIGAKLKKIDPVRKALGKLF